MNSLPLVSEPARCYTGSDHGRAFSRAGPQVPPRHASGGIHPSRAVRTLGATKPYMNLGSMVIATTADTLSVHMKFQKILSGKGNVN